MKIYNGRMFGLSNGSSNTELNLAYEAAKNYDFNGNWYPPVKMLRLYKLFYNIHGKSLSEELIRSPFLVESSNGRILFQWNACLTPNIEMRTKYTYLFWPDSGTDLVAYEKAETWKHSLEMLFSKWKKIVLERNAYDLKIAA